MTAAPVSYVSLTNFQSHVRSIIELAPPGHLTVIVGPTDSGKSAILRALRLLLYNYPRGIDYIRSGCTAADIVVGFADGRLICRERSRNSYNRYRIGSQQRHSEDDIYEGFGDVIPLEVQTLTGVRELEIGDLQIQLNYASQLEGPFLGRSISGPARARILGQLAGTEDIDRAAKDLHVDLHRANQDQKRLHDQHAQLSSDLAKYDWVAVLEKQLQQLDVLTESLHDNLTRHEGLLRLRVRYRQNTASIARHETVIQNWQPLDTLELTASGCQHKHQTYCCLLIHRRSWQQNIDRDQQIAMRARMLDPLDSIAHIPEQINDLNMYARTCVGLRDRLRQNSVAVDTVMQYLRVWSEERLKEGIAKYTQILENNSRLQTVAHYSERWMSSKTKIELSSQTKDRATQDVVCASTEYRNILLSAGLCPTCGTEIGPDAAINIMELAMELEEEGTEKNG